MRIAICGNSSTETRQHQNWIEQYCKLYTLSASFQCFTSPDAFYQWPGTFDIVYMGFGGNAGFLQARILRERDWHCRIIFIDDTEAFAIRCLRLHCTDFILRPVTFARIVQSMRRATGGGFP